MEGDFQQSWENAFQSVEDFRVQMAAFRQAMDEFIQRHPVDKSRTADADEDNELDLSPQDDVYDDIWDVESVSDHTPDTEDIPHVLNGLHTPEAVDGVFDRKW